MRKKTLKSPSVGDLKQAETYLTPYNVDENPDHLIKSLNHIDD